MIALEKSVYRILDRKDFIFSIFRPMALPLPPIFQMSADDVTLTFDMLYTVIIIVLNMLS